MTSIQYTQKLKIRLKFSIMVPLLLLTDLFLTEDRLKGDDEPQIQEDKPI